MELSSYTLEFLGHDDDFNLARAYPSGLEAPSVLLLVPASPRPAPESLKKLEHEWALGNELDSTWAVRPIELSQYNEQMVLVLEDPGGEPLDRLIEMPMEMERFLRTAIGLADALSHLHKRELIHKNVKPSNILVDNATGQVRLMGFRIASKLPREHQPPAPPEFIAGTLAYMAPEQTGRMNRSIDSRSDLYALGVTLYRMLTGSLPFAATEPMGWVHCHIARHPVPPHERLNEVPGSVSAIIMKLLAKTPEDRYQTATGVESDLRHCLHQWESLGRIDDFAIGKHDIPGRVLIPEKLYGRSSEIETLLSAFDRVVAGGRPELVLVSGYSGIGKSAVVNELHKPLVPPRGLFASGKFDQYKRDIPYATLAQAFQGLIRPLLSKSEEELGKWRVALREALDPNGQLMVDLVPELKLIIGEQPPVPELPPQDAQGRFELVFRRFIAIFARPEHPLALFLDDLQWLDAATLDLLEYLLTQPDVRYLLLIGAYRDNEVDPAHPLMRKLDAMRQARAILQDIVLAPLTREDLAELIADSIHCGPERAAPLAQLTHEKTAGNPFFAIQFISVLADEGLLTFDHDEGRWSWDLNRIRAKGYTDNVVDLMVGKLNRLPAETQTATQLLACLGNSSGFSVLRTVLENSDQQMHGRLWEAVRSGLIFRSEDSYRFLHDRVQEAAYSLIPQEMRAQTHLRIGMLLAARTPPEKLEEGIFEIVNQLNRGHHLITSRDERERVAELNFIAGRHAKTSAAYASALKYLAAGRALLSDESWDNNYGLIFNIELYMSECELLTANKVAAEDRLSMLAKKARTAHHVAVVARLRLTLYQTMDRSERAVEVCLEYLRRGGTDWSPHPAREEARREYDRIWSQLGDRQIEELVDLPLVTDPDLLDALEVLGEVVTPALCCDENLLALVLCRMVNLSLEHGNSDSSCFAYVWFAIIAGPCFGNYRDGFRFGRLGYELVEKRSLTRYQARTYMSFGNIVMPWAKHALGGRDLVRRAFDAAYRIGDLTFASYCCCELITNFLTVGDPLADVQPEAENALAFVQKAGFGLIIDIVIVQVGLIRTLRGLTRQFGRFNDERFDELQFERHLTTNPVLMLADFWYCARKTQARYFAGDYASAVDASSRAKPLLWTSPSQFETAEYHFYGALSRAAIWDSASPDQREQHFEALNAHHTQLEIWAAHCPENFENRAALVGAEMARIQGRFIDAEQLYEKAIRSARENQFVHNEALANEVAARFYLGRGLEKIAYAYLQDARYNYLRWGAIAKVRQLDSMYPGLGQQELIASGTSTIGTSVEQLDLATVIKISQAVSGEMVFDRLNDTLMRTAIEHAGAERALLIIPQGDNLKIKAEVTISGDTAVVRREGQAVNAMPESIVHFVVRTREIVVLEDAAKLKNHSSADQYIEQHHARSILCLPLVHQAKLIGVLYLENNLAPCVFTRARIAVLKLLATQAAVSLENTRLYADLEEREARIRRLVDANIIGIFTWNLEGQILEANDAFLHMMEYSRDDLLSGRMRWTELTPPEWKERADLAISELVQSGMVQTYEKEFFRKDGSRVPVMVGGALFEAGGGEGVAFVLDLSEQKRTEESYRVVVETASDAVITADESGVIRFANPATKRIFGYDPSELIGKPLTTLMPEFMRQLHEAGFTRYLATGQRHINWQGTELIGMRKNGEEFPLEIAFGEQIRTGHRSFTGFIRDITEKRRVQDALRRGQAYLAEAQRVSHTGSWYWNVASGELAWSREFYSIFGLDPEQTKPSYPLYFERIHPDDRFRVKELRWEAAREKRDFDAEYRLLLPGGTIKYVHSMARCSADQSGNVEYIGAIIDISERKRADEERERLRQAQADLAYINRISTMGELAASLAHEIKQPISAAMTDAKTCSRWLNLDRPELAEAQAAAARVVKDVTRASEIIGRVRSLFKKDNLQHERVDINEVIQEMIALLRGEAARYSISIDSHIARDLPPIIADRIQLQQVFMNLVLNGIDAVKNKNSPGKLTITSQHDGDHLLISVEDNGVGIPPEKMDQIFDAFFTSKPQGTGMGLPISRSIIESHGGHLWVVSNPESGATFHFTLPIQRATHQVA